MLWDTKQVVSTKGINKFDFEFGPELNAATQFF